MAHSVEERRGYLRRTHEESLGWLGDDLQVEAERQEVVVIGA